MYIQRRWRFITPQCPVVGLTPGQAVIIDCQWHSVRGRKEGWPCQKQILTDEGITQERRLTKGRWRGQSDLSVQGMGEPENHSRHIQSRKATGELGGCFTVTSSGTSSDTVRWLLSVREEAAFLLQLSLRPLRLTER